MGSRSLESHWCSRSIINIIGLYPPHTHLIVSYILGVLCTDLTIIVNFIAQVISVVTVIDRPLSWPILRVEAWVHGCQAHQILWTISVVKVRILKELNALRAQIVCYSCRRLEGALVLRLTSKASIAGLEVGPLNVWLCEWVEACVHSPAGIKGITELGLGADCGIKEVVARDHDWIEVIVFCFVLFVVVERTYDGTWAESWLSVSESGCRIGNFLWIINTEPIVSPQMGPRCSNRLLSRARCSTNSITRLTLVGLLLAQLKVFDSKVVDHGLDLAFVFRAFGGHSCEVELLLLSFKATVARDKVCSSVRVHGFLPRVGAGRMWALRIERCFLGGTVRLRWLANKEVSLG